MNHIFASISGKEIEYTNYYNEFTSFVPNNVKCKICEKYVYEMMSEYLEITNKITKENIELMNKLVPCLNEEEYNIKNILK